MVQAAGSDLAELERAELEVVLAALARNPRLAKLLRFLAERTLQGRTDEITEYAIATEVFDRSKTTFDGSTDSIARVEAYRLRKRLKEYYESEGKDHQIEISLPLRSYVPEFTRLGTSTPLSSSASSTDAPDLQQRPAVDANAEESEGPPEIPGVVRSKPEGAKKRILVYGATAMLVLGLLGFGIFFAKSRSAHSSTTANSSSPAGTPTAVPSNTAHVPLRLLAGYQGSPKIDSAGAYWEADRYFSGSGAFERPKSSIARTSDPMLFDHWRTGDFSYDIPLAPGTYELHLFFVASPLDDKLQFFDVTANGQPLLTAFNISADALGADIADEKIFKDISPDKDGFLHLKFKTSRAAPVLNAIELLPGLSHRQLPIRLVMQSAAVTDHNGNLWHPDNYFANGVLSDPPRQVTGTPDPNLYAQERYGHFTYSIPVDTRGRYTLVLHFAELYWVPDPSGAVGVGSRIFSVYCNGTTLLDHFDIFKEVGSLHAVTKTFSHLRPTPEGKLDLTFDPIANYATVTAIEVIDESE